MIYLITFIFTLSDVMYSKYQFSGSLKWHSWRLVRVISFFCGVSLFMYDPFSIYDLAICIAFNMASFPIMLNLIALNKPWNYVGTTSETDKTIGKYQWYTYGVILISSLVIKLFNHKNKKQ